MPQNPIQPIIRDGQGVLRFKGNAIVQFLLDFSTSKGCSMNELASGQFSADDRQQFAQLIGYSLGGYSELSYVTDEAYAIAEAKSKSLNYDIDERDLRIHYLQTELEELKKALRKPVARLYGKHPDDLMEEA